MGNRYTRWILFHRFLHGCCHLHNGFGILVTILKVYFLLIGYPLKERIFHARKHVIFETAGLGHHGGWDDYVARGGQRLQN